MREREREKAMKYALLLFLFLTVWNSLSSKGAGRCTLTQRREQEKKVGMVVFDLKMWLFDGGCRTQNTKYSQPAVLRVLRQRWFLLEKDDFC